MLISLRLKEPDLLVKQTADLYLLKEDKSAAPKVTAAPADGKDEEPVEATAASWLEGETVLAGRAIGNLQLALLGAGVVVLLLLIVLVLRRRKPAEANPPTGASELRTIRDKVAPVTPTGMPVGMAPVADSGKTVAVRGAGAITGQSAAEQPAPTQPVTRDNGKTVRMRGEGRQITSFTPSVAPTVEVMHVDCVLSDGQQMQAELECPVDFTIGREAGNSVVLPDPSVSGYHARITCAGPEVMLENISPVKEGLRNRLCVDRREIDGPTPLRSGAHLTVGTAAVTVTWTEARPVIGDEALRAPRRPAGDTTQRAPITLLEVSWTLEDGRQGKQAVKLAGRVTIGRDEKDTVVIPDPGVSQGHMIVTLEQGALALRNGSLDKGQGKNPFYCGSQAVYDQAQYREGQEIYAGGATIRLRLVR